jgi:AAA ATPase domain
MHKQHLTYFKVENFKRFDSLELSDIGQFNLVVGDNNVGKTSVLEALLVDQDRKKCLMNLHKTMLIKGLDIRPKMIYGSKGEVTDVLYPEENFLRYIFKNLKAVLKFSFKIGYKANYETLAEYQADYGTSVEIDMKMCDFPWGYTEDPANPDFDPDLHFTGKSPDNRYIQFALDDFSNFPDFHDDDANYGGGEQHTRTKEIAGIYEHLLSQNTNQWELPLISTSLPGDSRLTKSYFEQVDLSRKAKKQLIEDMKFLLPEIDDFEVRKIGGQDQLLIGIEGQDELMPISVFGESVSRVVQILMEIRNHKGKRLMIDEIDN